MTKSTKINTKITKAKTEMKKSKIPKSDKI